MNVRVFGAAWILAACAAAALWAPGLARAGDVQYVDVAEKAGIKFQHTFGDNHMSSILEATGAGCAFLDYDNDGWLDIFAVNGCYLEGISDEESDWKGVKTTCALYRNRKDGTFEDVTAKAGLAVMVFGMGVVCADYDNDGFTDLFLTNYAPSAKAYAAKNPEVTFRNLLFRNNGNGTFSDVTAKAGVGTSLWSVGAIWLDYDRDGRLDLFVGNYLDFDPEYRLYYVADEFPGPLSYPPQPHFLYRGNSDGTFTDVSAKAGIVYKGRAMGNTAADFNNDGWVDIYVANDAMANFMYRNNKDGTFTDVALESGTAFSANGDSGSSMSGEIGDYDNDGRLDIFVPDIKYKNLYRNVATDQFEDATTVTGVAEACGQFASWGGGFLDYDNDGDMDLFVSNGNEHRLDTQENVLLENVQGPDGKHVYRDAGPRTGKSFLQKNVARGAAIGDYDNDGDLDIFVLTLDQPSRLLRNDGGNKKNWLMLKLTGSRSNRDGVGARVTVRIGSKAQIRERNTADSYLSQHDPRLHFGLGDAAKVDHLTVAWPSGATQELKDVPANQILTIKEPEK
jgi:hypothetical protein